MGKPTYEELEQKLAELNNDISNLELDVSVKDLSNKQLNQKLQELENKYNNQTEIERSMERMADTADRTHRILQPIYGREMTLHLGGKKVGFQVGHNYADTAAEQDILTCIQEQMGSCSREVVENNMSVMSHFVPMTGAVHHFVANVLTASVVGVGAFFAGKSAGRRASPTKELDPHILVEYENESYPQLHFG